MRGYVDQGEKFEMSDWDRVETRGEGHNGKRRLPRVGAADQIARDLVEEIVGGVLPRGGKLPAEKELAQQYGVSQPTIREAIRALSMLGLVEARHGSGVYISDSSRQLVARSLSTLIQFHQIGILDVLDVRATLGRHAMERAAENATKEDVQAVVEALAFLEKQREARVLVAAIADFQVALSVAAHNPFLTAIESFLIGLVMHFQFAVYGSRGPAFWKRWTSESAPIRREIVTSLQHRAKGQLMKSMDAYLAAQRKHFVEHPELTSARLSPSWAEIAQGALPGDDRIAGQAREEKPAESRLAERSARAVGNINQ
jgi:GntR family transcriptional repressor for pyruvate dehydrogenase complex